MKKFKKNIIMITVVAGMTMGNGDFVFAENMEGTVEQEQMIDCLVDNGYTEGTAEALSDSDIELIYESIQDGSLVDVDSCSMEVDSLAEIENYLSYTKNELLEMGLSEEEIEKNNKQISEILSLTDEEIKKKYDMDDVQVKMLRKAADNGKKIQETGNATGKNIENKVNASGSIASSTMNFTQSVYCVSKKTPQYSVTLSYNWSRAYFYACFNDKIACAWGSELNIANVSGRAEYFYVTYFNNFKDYKKSKDMSTEVVYDKGVNKGVIFTFPQSYGWGSNGCGYKSKVGFASFKLSKSKSSGKQTVITSNYCHRVLNAKSSSIKMYTNPSYAEIVIGGAWDTTASKTNKISY